MESLKNIELEIWKMWKMIIEIKGEDKNVQTRKGIQWNKY